MFAKWTSRRRVEMTSKKTAKRHPRRASMSMETLEGRRLMAANAALVGNVLRIEGTNVADVARVEVSGTNLRVVSRSTGENVDTIQSFPAARVNSILFLGRDGDDRFTNNTAKGLTAHGGYGHDVLIGGSGADVINGEWGNDRLIGNDGNDQLNGGPDQDVLYGGVGGDILDGGSGRDFLDTGANAGDVIRNGADDFNARVPVVNGTTMEDIDQRASPTCCFLAALQGVARNGVDLAGRITYMGEGLYRVGIFTSPNMLAQITVRFEGDVTSRDPAPNGNEFWTTLYQRAYVQRMGREVTDGGEALLALTGRNARSFIGLPLDVFDLNFNEMRVALRARKAVLAGTSGALLSNPLLVGNATADRALGEFLNGNPVSGHCYTVIDAFVRNGVKMVRLRNPWGVDGGALASGDPNDGLIELSYASFKSSFGSMWVEG